MLLLTGFAVYRAAAFSQAVITVQWYAQVVNSHLVCDPTIRQPGFDLPRQQWSLPNHFRRKEMATYRHWSVSFWRDPDYVPHCRILSPDETEWQVISATLCGWRRCFVADQLWFMTCIQEKNNMQANILRFWAGPKPGNKDGCDRKGNWNKNTSGCMAVLTVTHLCDCCRPASGHTVTGVSERGPAINQEPHHIEI